MPRHAASTFALAPQVHAVDIEGDLVILDVAKDRYLCLPRSGSELRLTPSRRLLRIASQALTDDFTAAGLLAADPYQPVSYPVLPAPGRSALAPAYPPLEGRDVPAIISAVWDAQRHYRGRALTDLLRARGAGQGRRCEDPSSDLLAEVEAFHRWIPYAPLPGKCLLRSFVLLGCLQRAGHDAHWVFGVSTWPFRAHCWLQCGVTVLDDRVERVRAFQPIMVL